MLSAAPSTVALQMQAFTVRFCLSLQPANAPSKQAMAHCALLVMPLSHSARHGDSACLCWRHAAILLLRKNQNLTAS